MIRSHLAFFALNKGRNCSIQNTTAAADKMTRHKDRVAMGTRMECLTLTMPERYSPVVL